jgi:hypothetical protein
MKKKASSLRDLLVADNEYFKCMLGMLPPQLLANKDEVESAQDDEGTEEEEKGMNSDDDADLSKAIRGAAETRVSAMDVDEENESAGEEDLQTKLKKKLEVLRAKRCKPGLADKLEQHRLKRRLSKAKLKQRRLKEKLTNGSAKPPDSEASKQSPATAKPIFNKDGKMVFSKFDFSDNANGGKLMEKKKKMDLPTGKNYKHLLEKVQKQKEKLEKLEKEDKEKATQFREKVLWKTALSKAEGVKVKDDVELLRRAQKKKEKRAKQSRKAWQRREDGVAKKKQGQQAKRKQNIMKRKDAKQEKVKNKNKKRGRMIPGF